MGDPPLRQPRLDKDAVRTAYKAWAPIYDYSFGLIATPGRRLAVSLLNREHGRILEIGVGTGLALPGYKKELHVTGIDLSEAMLARAADRIRKSNMRGKALALMDAAELAFASESFDAAVAMYVMTVVPDPARVMDEMWRILRPGGTAIVVNHFSREGGIRGSVERRLARFSRRLGWHPVFPLSHVTGSPGFSLIESTDLPPFGLFTLLRLQKVPKTGAADSAN
jgi:phosphatidylethanolamine/phosphatidyl-N-methylethanolamine N-methyltransferase